MTQLSLLSEEHIDEIQRFAADPSVLNQTLLPNPYPPDGARSFVEHIREARLSGAEFAFAVEAPSFAGVCGVRRTAPGVGEIGYWLGQPFRGRGLGRDAAGMLVDFCRETGLFHTLTARVLDTNTPSVRVLEGAGLRESHRTINGTNTRWPADAVIRHYTRALSPEDADRVPGALHTPLYTTRGAGEHGDGVFARAPIRRHTLAMLMRGRLIHSDEITPGLRVMQLGPDQWLAERPESPDASDFVNHSCAPNLGFSDGSTALYTLRDIAPGEELCFDYSTTMNEPGWSMRCLCGSSDCRGLIQSFDELPEAQQRRLAPRALAWLRLS